MKVIGKMTKVVAVLFVLGLLVSATLEGGAIEAQMNTLKEECKEMISGTRYEGSKVTYYSVGDKQKKSIELYMFMNNEYHFAVNAKKSSVSIGLKIYDADESVKDRLLIKEYKKINGQAIKFTSTELNELYRKKVKGVERLKTIVVEYQISSGKIGKEGVVLVYGSKP